VAAFFIISIKLALGLIALPFGATLIIVMPPAARWLDETGEEIE